MAENSLSLQCVIRDLKIEIAEVNANVLANNVKLDGLCESVQLLFDAVQVSAILMTGIHNTVRDLRQI